MKNSIRIISPIIVSILFISSCASPTYCECDEQISEAKMAALGMQSNPNFRIVEDCNEMVNRDLGLNIRASKMSLDFSSQVAYQMCEQGYYEGMHSNDKGVKYYPKK
tara:strand:- start:197 stop:517 length:321 start_codon:yes stop_codon:yes gene_type:complete